MSQVEEPPAFSPMTGPDAGLARLGPDVAAAISAYVSRGPFGVAVFDTDLRFLLVSEGLAALHGQEASSTIGKTIDEVLPPPFGALVSRPLREALETGNPILGVNTWGTFDDPGAPRSFTSSFYRLDDARGMAVGVVVLLTETTELRYAETAARSATDQLALLQEVTETLSSADDAIDVTRAVLTGAAQAVGASAAVIMALDPGSDNLVHLASSGLSDATLSYLEAIAPLAAELPHSDALRTRSLTTWSSRAERDAKYPALRSISADHQSWAFVPLLSRDGGVGVVAFAWRIDRHFPEADLAVLAAVGRQCGLALEQARILDAERESRRATAFLVEVTRFVVEGLDAGVFAISNGNRILTFNQRFCSLLGFEDVELGGDAVALLEPCLALVADPNTVRHHLGACRSTPAATIEVDIDLNDGRVISCTSSPIFDRRGIVLGRVWYIRDVTETRAHEAERRLVQDELLASHGQQAFLLEAAELVAQGESYDDTVQRLASAAVPVLADLCLVDAFTMDGRLVRMAARHADPRLQPLADELSSKYAPDPSGNHPSVDVIDTGRPRWSESMSDDFLRRTSRDEEHFTLLKRLGFTSYMALPLIADNHILGSVTLVSAGSGRRFGQRDLALAEEFTSRVAQVVATAHRNESDRHAAHTLQASLLPETLPTIAGLDLAARYLPATVDDDVGGDFYDVIPGPRYATFAIGDVAGHDMTAAAMMGKLRTAVRVLASQADGPWRLIEMLRRGWDDLELQRMATLLIVTVDAATGELRVASAGHPPPLLVDTDGSRLLDVRPTTPLGAPPSPVGEWHGSMAAGASLLLYTDGLVEDRRRTFDQGTLALQRAADRPLRPAALCDRVLTALIPDETHHDDDVAMVALTRTAVPTSP